MNTCPHDTTVWPDNWHAECLDCGQTFAIPHGHGALGVLENGDVGPGGRCDHPRGVSGVNVGERDDPTGKPEP